MSNTITKCSRCHAPFEDMRIEIQLQTAVERRKSNLDWEKISNMTLQSREILCPECFNKFAAALETLNVEMAKKDHPATEIIQPDSDPQPQASSSTLTPAQQRDIQPEIQTVQLPPDTSVQPFDQSTPSPSKTVSSARHSLINTPIRFPQEEDKPITFTESLHPPMPTEDPNPSPGLDEDPTIDELLANVRYADEPIQDDTGEPKQSISEPDIQIRPFGIPRSAVHTSTIS